MEELLRQADELMESQKPRAEVYAAMAHSLGLAWSDLNALLLLRKQILELNVAFHWYANVALHKRESVCTYTGMPSRLALTLSQHSPVWSPSSNPVSFVLCAHALSSDFFLFIEPFLSIFQLKGVHFAKHNYVYPLIRDSSLFKMIESLSTRMYKNAAQGRVQLMRG